MTQEASEISIDLINSDNNKIEILKSNRMSLPEIKVSSEAITDEINTARVRVDLIQYYEDMVCEIDLQAEKLLQSLPEALSQSRQELLEKIEREKVKSLEALGPNSPVVQRKNEYHQQFIQLRDEYKALSASSGDDKRKEELMTRLEELKRNVLVLEEFLEDFKTRTLNFEEVDKSVFEALIGELVLTNNDNQQIDTA